jgi:hypothetical protein
MSSTWVAATEALEPHARSPCSAKSCRATRVCYDMQGRVGDCLVRRCGVNWGSPSVLGTLQHVSSRGRLAGVVTKYLHPRLTMSASTYLNSSEHVGGCNLVLTHHHTDLMHDGANGSSTAGVPRLEVPPRPLTLDLDSRCRDAI